MAPLLFGSAATTAGVAGATTTAAATTGLIGTAGAFALAPTLLTVGTGLAVGGALKAGAAAQQESKLQQQILEQNAKIKEREAKEVERRGRIQAEIFGEFAEETLGATLARIGKSGVTGVTPALVLDKLEDDLESERRQILENAFKGRSFTESQATGLRFQGTVAGRRGRNLRRSSFIKAGTTAGLGFGSILTG